MSEEFNVDTIPQEEIAVENDQSTNQEVDTTQQTETVPEQQKIKVKFNHEEMEMPYEEAVKHIQKGMNYDKVYEKFDKLQSDPRLSFVEELAKEFDMSPEEYIEEVRKAKEQEKLNSLIQQNIPEELATEIIQNRKFREQMEAERRSKEAEQKQQMEYQEFLNRFPDVKAENITKETWDLVAQGTPIKYAYMEQLLKEKDRNLEIATHNDKVKNATTGSVTGQAGNNEDFISPETFIANRHNQDWVNKNYKILIKSRAKW